MFQSRLKFLSLFTSFQDEDDMIPLFKDKHPESYRLESLTLTPRQVMEQTLLETISQLTK